MRRMIFAAAIATAVAMPVQAKNSVVVVNNGVYGFVGYSTGTTDGGQGFIHMHRLCQEDFGETARLCTSEEFLSLQTQLIPLKKMQRRSRRRGYTLSSSRREESTLAAAGASPVRGGPLRARV